MLKEKISEILNGLCMVPYSGDFYWLKKMFHDIMYRGDSYKENIFYIYGVKRRVYNE